MKIGRNDPCPCGSGIKYKKCCEGKQGAGGPPPGARAVMDELSEVLKGQSFASLEEANAFLSRHMQERNLAPADDFHGLSPQQMHRFLHFPFDSPALVNFPDILDVIPQAPIMTLFSLLVNGIGDEGLKATATGNLPRNFCREAANSFLGEEEYWSWSKLGELRSETEFQEMHVARLVAELSGLIRKYKVRFILGRECRKLLAGNGPAGIYPRLFHAFVKKYNWGYQDGYEEIPFIQQSFLFTLYLLDRYGKEWRTNKFYEDSFLRAFPTLLPQVQPMGSSYSPEQVLRNSYSLRCLEHFAEFLGLAEIERDPGKRFFENFRLRKLPLLDHVVKFQL